MSRHRPVGSKVPAGEQPGTGWSAARYRLVGSRYYPVEVQVPSGWGPVPAGEGPGTGQRGAEYLLVGV